MVDKSKIKIVKKGDAKTAAVVHKKLTASPRIAAREMVATVSDWVSEIKQRKSEETKAAIEMLLASTRRPTEG